jgi:cholest-4-en-3-one 26-monooxygenase
MTITPTSVDQIDLTDCDLFLHGDPDAVWTTLRREAPVHWNDRSWGPGFWNITRYADVMRVSTDTRTFISGKGIILDNDGRRTQREQAMNSQGYGMDPRGNMMIMTDPPRHTVLRRIVNKGFTPLAVRRMEPHIRSLVTKILDDVIERGECDFVLDISRRLPLEVICEMVGVPEGDWEGMFDLTNRVIGFDDPEFARDEITQEEMQLSFNLFQYMGELIGSRRTDPREDVLSTLVNTEIDGTTLNDGEIFLMFLLLIVAGNETTRNATTGGMLAMLNSPDQRQRLIDDPSLIPTAVEEVVRWTSPVMHFERVATKDVEIGDQQIKEGDEVTLWYTSANRDEAIFENPQTFDVGRSPNEHIAFGKGEHFCLGANLARLELVVMFEELLKRIPDMELAGQPERLRSNFIRGIKRMPVTFTPGAKSA